MHKIARSYRVVAAVLSVTPRVHLTVDGRIVPRSQSAAERPRRRDAPFGNARRLYGISSD